MKSTLLEVIAVCLYHALVDTRTALCYVQQNIWSILLRLVFVGCHARSEILFTLGLKFLARLLCTIHQLLQSITCVWPPHLYIEIGYVNGLISVHCQTIF